MNAETEKEFRTLIAAADKLTRLGCKKAETLPDFKTALNLLNTKAARLELKIGFNPAPFVIGQLIRDDDGEIIGELFHLEALFQPTH